MKEQETHFCGDPSECHYDEGYEKALKECKKMFDDYKEKLKEAIFEDDFNGYQNMEILKHFNKIIDKLSKEVMGE